MSDTLAALLLHLVPLRRSKTDRRINNNSNNNNNNNIQLNNVPSRLPTWAHNVRLHIDVLRLHGVIQRESPECSNCEQ